MLRVLTAVLLALPLFAGAAEITIGIADQHKAALDIHDGRFTGTLAAKFQCPLDRSGLEIKMIWVPHARLLLQLRRGEVDIGMPLIRLDERDVYAEFAQSLMPIEFALFSKQPIALDADLSKHSFVILRSTASSALVKKRNGNVVEVSSWSQALELARLGRYDGAVIPLAVIPNLAPGSFTGLIQSSFASLPISFYVSRAIDNTETLLQRLNDAIDACRD